MTETYQFGLPLVQPAQAQKHVTVNEALSRLDVVAQLRVVERTRISPPAAPVDGESYLLPIGAMAAWLGHDGEIAIWANGGWVFLVPKVGWRLWDEESSSYYLFDGASWVANAASMTSSGAATGASIIEVDHTIGSEAVSIVGAAIPANSQVIGVTGRVIQEVTGAATSWRLGVTGSDNRYGSGLGLALNSFVRGLTGAPVTYYADTDLILTAEGGAFSNGVVRIAIHVLTLTPPRAV